MTGFCTTVSPRSKYGFGQQGGDWGGMLSDLALVPYAEAMLVGLPQGVDPAIVASAADNIVDGWRTVAPGLAEFPGADVLVVSGGFANSVPLYAVDAALALGAASVTYVDSDLARLDIARRLGAVVIEGQPEKSLGKFLVTVAGTITADGLLSALRFTEPGGRCTSTGHIENEASMPMYELWSRSVHLHIAIAQARPDMPAVLGLIAAGRLRPQLITSDVVAWDDAPEAWLEPAIKLVVKRD
jgi:alcohol dehydrogenase